MSKIKKLLSVLLSAIMACTLMAGLAGCGKRGIVIYVDAGGANGNFNTTASLKQSPENPYPYNTLEVLAKEYMAQHPDVKIVINKTSLNGDREKILSRFTQRTAPHLLFQVSPSWDQDAMNGWVVDLTDELEKPNPYIAEGQPGSEKWKDIYIEKELLATQAGNGRYYFVCLEKIPIGIIYNKDIFDSVGVSVPTTYGEMMEVQKKIYDAGIRPYLPIYDWYDIFLEVSLFSPMFDVLDTIDKDGFISAEELCRAYVKGDWGISNRPTTEAELRYREYFRLIKEKAKYYGGAYESFDPLTEFLRGKVAMIEATGGYMIQVNGDQSKTFDVDVFGFPTVTEEDSVYGGNSVYRGTAGLCTGWCVTNRAVKDGQATVDASIDFLKFLTAPQNNDRMINDLGFGLPISTESENINPLFQPLVDMYNQDLQDDNRFDWNTFCSWNDFGKEYYDKFLKTVWAYQNNEIDTSDALKEMAEATEKAIKAYMELNGWTADTWD